MTTMTYRLQTGRLTHDLFIGSHLPHPRHQSWEGTSTRTAPVPQTATRGVSASPASREGKGGINGHSEAVEQKTGQTPLLPKLRSNAP